MKDHMESAQLSQMEELNSTTDSDNKEDRKCMEIDRYMLPAKISYFFQNGKFAIDDYLMLFYTSIGLSPSEAGYVNGTQYIGGAVGSPLWSYIADKKGHHRLILLFLCLMALPFFCAQPFIGWAYSPESNSCPANHTLNTSPIVVKERNSLFYLIMTAVILASSFDSTIESFIDGGVLLRVRNCPGGGANIGKQRYSGSLGRSFASIMYSLSIHYFPAGSVNCCTGLFITYLVFSVSTGVSSHFLYQGLVMPKKEERSDTTKFLWMYVMQFDSLPFFFSVLLNGILQALYFSFIFLYLKSLQAPTILLGFATSLNTISAVVVYIFSERIIQTLDGPTHAMCFSTFMWGLRFLCTAALMNPYYIFIIDLFHGFTYSLFRVSYLKYVNETTDERICTSVCGIANALYKCCSSILANAIGGILYEQYGAHQLFNGAAAVSFGWSMISIVYLVYVLKNRTSQTYKRVSESDSDGDVDVDLHQHEE